MTSTAETLGKALQTIYDENVEGDFKVGAAAALGVLAEAAHAAPGSSWMDVAKTLVGDTPDRIAEPVAEGVWCQNCEYLEKPEDLGGFRCQSCGCAVSVHINVKVIAS